jgi:hypothetical protein
MPDLDELLVSDDEEAFYDALDDLIIANMTPDQNDLTDFGAKLQIMYDNIFYRDIGPEEQERRFNERLKTDPIFAAWNARIEAEKRVNM